MNFHKKLICFAWQFMRHQKWVFSAIFLLDSLSWPLDALLWPYILHLVVDIFSRYDFDRMAALEALSGPIVGGLCLVIFVEVSARTMGFLMAKAIPKLQADMRLAMFDHIQHHTPHYFNERFAGSLANKVTDMTTQVELILQQLFWPIIPSIATCILGSIFLWFVSPIFAWILLGWIVIHLSACLMFMRPCDHYEHQHGEARSTLLGKIVDSLTNNFTVNLFFRFKHERNVLVPFQKEEEETKYANGV